MSEADVIREMVEAVVNSQSCFMHVIIHEGCHEIFLVPIYPKDFYSEEFDEE